MTHTINHVTLAIRRHLITMPQWPSFAHCRFARRSLVYFLLLLFITAGPSILQEQIKDDIITAVRMRGTFLCSKVNFTLWQPDTHNADLLVEDYEQQPIFVPVHLCAIVLRIYTHTHAHAHTHARAHTHTRNVHKWPRRRKGRKEKAETNTRRVADEKKKSKQRN